MYHECIITVLKVVGYWTKTVGECVETALRTQRERRQIALHVGRKYAVRSDCLGWDEVGCHMFTSLTLRDCQAFLAHLTAPYRPLAIEALVE